MATLTYTGKQARASHPLMRDVTRTLEPGQSYEVPDAIVGPLTAAIPDLKPASS